MTALETQKPPFDAPEPAGLLAALPLPVPVKILLLLGLFGLVAVACDLLLTVGPEPGATAIVEVDVVTSMRTGADDSTTVELPHRCLPGPESWDCSRLFRIGYAPEAGGDADLSLYVPYFSGSLRIRLNGTVLTDSRWVQSSFYLHQSAPLLVPLPAPLLRPGDNTIELLLDSQLAYGGFLGPFYVGPDHLLRPGYNVAHLMVAMLPRLIDGALIAMSGFMLLIWLVRPQDHVYLLFCIILLSFAASSLPAILIDAPGEGMLRLTNLSRFIGGSLALPFAWHFVGRRPPVPAGVFLLLPVLLYVCILALPGARATWLISTVFGPLALALAGGAVMVLLREAIRGQSDAALLLFAAAVAALALGVRDFLVLAGLLEDRHLLLARFNGPLIAAAVGAILMRRFVAGLTALEIFNTRLRQAVTAAEEKLRQTFAREQEQVRKAALEAERVRLMSDLHDGIAGHLVSIMSLCEQSRAGSSTEIAEASRRALADLRLVVDSLEDVGDDIGLMLGAFRERIEPQLRRTGIRLDWRVRALPELPGLHPSATLAIFRILQEAVANAARHSGSCTVTIEAGPPAGPASGLRLTVQDHGHGGAADRPGGFGMENMRRRASLLGAKLAIRSGPQGTAVILDLPPRLAAEAAIAGSGGG